MQEEKQTSNIQLSSTPQPTHYTSNKSLKKIQLSSCSRPGNGCNFPAENFRPWRVPIPGMVSDAAPSAQRSLLFHSHYENQTVRVPGKVGPCLKSPCRCNGRRPQSCQIITDSHHDFTENRLLVRSESRGGTQCDFKRGIAPKQARQNFCVSCACRNTSPQLFCLQGTLQLGLLNVSFMLLTNAGWHHSDSGFVTFGCHV